MLSEHMTTAERLRQPDDSRLAEVTIETFGTDAEAAAFLAAVEKFELRWPGLLDVHLMSRGNTVYTFRTRGPSATDQAKSLAELWYRAAVWGRSEMAAHMAAEQSGATE